jgi:signal transduction histidine kinase
MTSPRSAAAAAAPPPAPAGAQQALLSALVRRFNHDLRTPLNTLSGWSELLREGASDAGRVRHAAQVMSRSVREQTLLLEDYVDDMRTVLGELTLHAAFLSLSEVHEAVGVRLAPLAALYGVAIETAEAPVAWRIHGELRHTVRLLYRLGLLAVRCAAPDAVLRQQVEADEDCLRFSIVAPTGGASATAGGGEVAALEQQLVLVGATAAGGGFALQRGAATTEMQLSLPRAPDLRSAARGPPQ